MPTLVSSQLPIVLCPLQFERKALERAGLARRFELACCGPGPQAIKRWADANGPINRPIILAGLAGALTAQCPVGSAWIAREVVDPGAVERWRPNFALNASAPEGSTCILTAAAAILTTPAAKLQVQSTSGADLADLESVMFARIATDSGWTWTIVRGVSDDARTGLPANIEQWVDAAGQARGGAVLASILRRPALIPGLFQLRAHSRAAMQAVAGLLLQVGGSHP